MVLFQHFYEQIGAFEDEEVHLDLSGDDEVNVMSETFQALLMKLKWFCSNISMNR